MRTTHKSFCRVCSAGCAIEVDIEDGKAVAVRGDKEDPYYGGYTCEKGRQFHVAHHNPSRLLHSQRRRPDGAFEAVRSEQAIDEIAVRLRQIIDRHGPRSVAFFTGTYAYYNSAVAPLVTSIQQALGTPNLFTPVTIDQPAKGLTMSRMGTWRGGLHGFGDADVALVFGNNVLESHYAPPGGVPPVSPSLQLREAQARGLKLVVVDPRETQLARKADIHLQIRPGEDAVLIAGMLKIVFDEELYDREFCDRWVDGVEELRSAVADFGLDYVALRTGLDADSIVAATRAFAGPRRGSATSGTGPEMAEHGLLTETLLMALNIVCGRLCREGDTPIRQPVLLPQGGEARAEVVAPRQSWGEGFLPTRVHGLTQIAGQMPCGVFADDVLTPGEGQIRAFIVVGGNPVVSFPGQEKVVEALDSLELLVTVDNRMSQTARRAHYVIAPSMALERDDFSTLGERLNNDMTPYARYTEALLPPSGDTVNDWEFLWEIAKRLGLQLQSPGGPIPMDRKPTTVELQELFCAGGPVTPTEVRDATAGRSGKIYDEVRRTVLPGTDADGARMLVTPDDLVVQLRGLREETVDADGRRPRDESWTHLYVSRRLGHVINSTGHDLPAARRKGVTNCAYLHPDDLVANGLGDGQLVTITGASGSLYAITRASSDVRPGVVSLAHAFGDVDTGREGVREHGNSTNRLSTDARLAPITGMPQSSAIPVRIQPVRPDLDPMSRAPEAAVSR